MQIVWTEQALLRVIEQAEYIAHDKPNAAQRWADAVLEYPNKLIDSPKLGRMVPDFDEENLRELIYGAYRIIYQINGDTIEILTVKRFSQLLNQNELM